MVRRSKQTHLDSPELAIWACLDTLVYSYGDRGLVSVAKDWT
jgi:hypothetical protein